jgi:hypothetical protein
MYVLQFPGQDLSPVTKYIMNQPAVRGGNVFVQWATVEKSRGVYDWSSIEKQITPWAAIGKPVNLIVWPLNYNVPQTGAPAYVLADPDYQSVTCPYFGSMPLYYAGSYRGLYKTFIAVVMNRYGNDPRIGYIRFGLSQGGEAFPTCLAQMMAVNNDKQSQFNTRWENYILEMQAYQNNLPHTVQLMSPTTQFGTPVQYSVNDWEASNAVSLGFGFGTNGLQQSDLTSYPTKPCISDWCANFQTYTNRVPLEMQTIGYSDPTNAPGGVGSLTVLLPFASSLGANVFEIYIQDWRVAFDPTSPNYLTYGAGYRQVFHDTAAALGY